MTPDPIEALIQWLKDTQVCFCDTCALTNDGMAERQIRLHAAQLIKVGQERAVEYVTTNSQRGVHFGCYEITEKVLEAARNLSQ